MRTSHALLAMFAVTGVTGVTGCTQMLQKATGHGGVSRTDQPAASAIAASSAGTILFSTAPIPRGPTDAATLATTFDLDHPLYWRAFFKRSAANTITDAKLACDGGRNEFRMEVRDDGAGDDAWKILYQDSDYKFGEAFLTWTTLSSKPGRLVAHGEPEPSAETTHLFGMLTERPRGPVHLELRMVATCTNPTQTANHQHAPETKVELARSKVTIEVSDVALASYVKVNHLELSGVAFADGGQSRKIESEVRRLLPGQQIVTIMFDDTDWNVERNALDTVLRRFARGTVVIRHGAGCRAVAFRAVEDTLGGGSFVSTPTLEAAALQGDPVILENSSQRIACQQVAGQGAVSTDDRGRGKHGSSAR